MFVSRLFDPDFSLELDTDSTLALDPRGVHEFDLYYFSPIIETPKFRLAFIGDVEKYVPFSGN